jgi:hypothetical protein
MLTADEEPVRLYEDIADGLWRRALKGSDAGLAVLRAVARSLGDRAAAAEGAVPGAGLRYRLRSCRKNEIVLAIEISA